MTGAAGGNVAASSGAFMQAAAVNYLQGLGASGVKQIADQLGQGPQAEIVRASLHSIVGCAGGAGQGAACASGALGAGAGSILNSLMGPASELTLQQAEARRNIVTSLVAGIASSTGLSAAPASTAATLETTNNFAQVVAVAATAATAKCAIYEGCQRVVTHVADKTMYVAVQMKDALYVGSAALVGMVAASDTVGNWVSNFVGEVVSGTTPPGKPGEVVHVVNAPPLPAAQDRFGSEIPVSPAKPVGPIAVPGQENKGPATGMITETPLLEPQGPGLIFSERDGASNSATMSDILLPNGEPVGYGYPGAGPRIRTVTSEQFGQLQSQLMNGATPIATPSGYVGTWYGMPDGSVFGIRTSTESGTTIDVIKSNNPSLPSGFKVHQQ